MKRYPLMLIIIMMSMVSFAQIRSSLSFNNTKVVKEKGLFNAPDADKTLNVQIDRDKELKEVKKEEELGLGLPYRFGKGVEVNNTLENSGTWFKTEGGRVWKLRIKSPSAYSLNLIFNKLFISGSTELYIYNEDRTMLYGPVTSSSITSSRFYTDLIKGDGLILELFEPFEETGKTILHLTGVVHGFRNTFEPTVFGSSSGCQDDVSCNAWAAQADGVAMIILANGTRLCSGSLLNNACQDFTPNILTAFHCLDIGNDINNIDACTDNEVGNGTLTAQETANAENWFFRFQYRRATCNTGTEPNNYITFQQGATVRAGWANTDFALVQMDHNPAQVANTGIRYLGWSRANIAPTSGAILGHPQGDVMKISTYNTNAASNNNPITWTLCTNPVRQAFSNADTHWTTTLNDGALERGSSGGPFFDQNGRVVGQLHGGAVGCAPTISHSGRFDVSWNGGGNAATQLSTWLTNDPNVMSVDAIAIPHVAPQSGNGYPIVCNTYVGYNLINAPSTATHNVGWTATPNLTIVSQGSSSVLLRYSGSQNGIATINANISSTNTAFCSVVRTFSLNVYAGPFKASDITISGQNAVCNGGYYTYTANVPFGHQSWYSYSWAYPSGWSVYSQSQNQITLYTGNGNFGGQLRVAVTNGCGTSDYKAMTVYAMDCGLAVNNNIALFPNPSTDELTVETDGKGQYEISIMDRMGKVLISTIIESEKGKASIDVSKFQKGMYYVKVQGENFNEIKRIAIE